jgi:hypothetical protein
LIVRLHSRRFTPKPPTNLRVPCVSALNCPFSFVFSNFQLSTLSTFNFQPPRCDNSFPYQTSKISPVSPIIATDPKSPSRNSFACHTCETPGGVPIRISLSSREFNVNYDYEQWAKMYVESGGLSNPPSVTPREHESGDHQSTSIAVFVHTDGETKTAAGVNKDSSGGQP